MYVSLKIEGFDWDAGNREKCQRHGLTEAEVESVFLGHPRIGMNSNHKAEEARFHAVGKTIQYRYAYVVFTFRTKFSGTMIRPISARYMHKKEIAHYEKQTQG